MKKLILSLLSLALLLPVLSACSSDDTPEWASGEVRDGAYVNASIGMSFILPENWIEASAEETRSILGADPNDTSTIYDILLGPRDGSGMMYVICMDLRKQIGGKNMTEDDALTDTIESIRADATLQYTFSEIGGTQLCGMEYRYVDVTSSGGASFQRTMMHKLSSDKMLLVGVTAPSEAILDYYLAHFTTDASTIPAPPTPTPTRAFSHGVVDGSVYTSSYLGLSFTVPEGWNFASDEELAELMGLSLEMFGEEIYGDMAELAKRFAQQAVIYDMAAAAPDGSGSVQVVLENMAMSIGSSSMTEAQYADIVRQQFANISEFTYEIEEPYTQEFAGKTFTVLDASVAEYEMTQRFYLLRVDNYMLCITLTSAQGLTAALADCFTAA